MTLVLFLAPMASNLVLMSTAQRMRRWLRPTPDRVVIGLLVVQCLLWLSERYGWFEFSLHKGWTVLIALAVVGAAMLLMLIWLLISLISRLRFQFSLRSLLVLTLAVALSCSWLGVETKMAREQRHVVEGFKNSGGKLGYDYQIGSGITGRQEPEGPAWLIELLGRDFFANPFWAEAATDKEVQLLIRLPRLDFAIIDGARITEKGLLRLAEMKQLQVLRIAPLPPDVGVFFGLEPHSPEDWCRVTDAGLDYLKESNRLACLKLVGPKLTDASIRRIRQALPDCEIVIEP